MQVRGPGAGGGYVLNVEAPQRTPVNAEWRFRIGGLQDMHSLLIELYGANGGLFRLFPRGRNVMDHALVLRATGRTTIVMIGRDARLQPLVSIAGDIDVEAAGVVAGPGAGGGYQPLETFAPLAPLGPVKPPFAASIEPPGSVGAAPRSGLDALIDAKKAELYSRFGKT